jgi:FdhD protein
MPPRATKPILRWEGGHARELSDELAEEEPLEIRVRGRAISVTMRTGGHDPELAAGFLLSEQVIRRRADILHIEPCQRNEYGNIINVRLAPEVVVDFERLTRHVLAASSCGLCGKATIEAIQSRMEPITGEGSPLVDPAVIATLPQKMRETQIEFDRTGGLHAAAIFDAAGNLLVLREDVGRHNAVDKVLGFALLNDLLPLERHVLLVSGRTSFEIMQKSLSARLAIVAGVSAPSSLAVQFAIANGQTLIGFLRGDRMNIYAGAQRLGLRGLGQ